MTDSLKIYSLNTRGTVGKIDHIIALAKQCDILCIQEQRFGENKHQINERIKNLEKKSNCKVYHSKIPNKNLGIALLVKQHILNYIKNYKVLTDGRTQLLELNKENKIYNIINLYGPARETHRGDFYKNFLSQIKNLKNRIIIGDWNLILHADETSGLFRNTAYCKNVQNFMEQQNLKDVHKILNSSKIKYTFTGTQNSRTRIDKIFTEHYLIRK